ncbi:MAG: hypothetical protein K8R02_09510 [Anaerohalosphaeraceae bacterium]|nr:hypothetical protein [Anaerohalosphaeraceae bacterium]
MKSNPGIVIPGLNGDASEIGNMQQPAGQDLRANGGAGEIGNVEAENPSKAVNLKLLL